MRTNIVIDGKVLEHVENYMYLGSVIKQDGRYKEETKTRIVIAKTAFNKTKPLIINRYLTQKLKKRFIKCYRLAS